MLIVLWFCFVFTGLHESARCTFIIQQIRIKEHLKIPSFAHKMKTMNEPWIKIKQKWLILCLRQSNRGVWESIQLAILDASMCVHVCVCVFTVEYEQVQLSFDKLQCLRRLSHRAWDIHTYTQSMFYKYSPSSAGISSWAVILIHTQCKYCTHTNILHCLAVRSATFLSRS